MTIEARAINAGLTILAATTLSCSVRTETTAPPATKSGFSTPIPTQDLFFIPISEEATRSSTDCSKRGELLGIKPDFEGPPNMGTFREVIARAYDVRNNGRSGIYIVTIEPGTLKKPVEIKPHKNLPIGITIDLSNQTARVNITMDPRHTIGVMFDEANVDNCNVIKTSWNNGVPQRASFNNQTINLTDPRRV